MSNSIIKKTAFAVAVIILTFSLSLTAFSAEEAEIDLVQEPATEVPAEPEKPEKSGFIAEGGELYYYLPETGEKFVPEKDGVYTFEGKAYLFTKEGKTVKYNSEEKFTAFSSQQYCLNKDNSLYSGLITYKGATYCFHPDTYNLVKGWVTLKDGKRYFDSVGKMVKGLKKISGNTYYLGDNGVMKTGFVAFKEGKRYFGSDGKMRTGFVTFKEGKRYFSPDGIIVKGWVTFKEGKRHFASNGIMRTGFVDYKEGRRYFNSDGILQKGLTKISKKTYYFGSKAYMKVGWVEFKEGKRYFSKKNGVMLTGKTKIGSKYYYLNGKGIMKKGWVTIDSNKYYFSKKTGAMLTGWNKISDKYYYFSSNGKMKKNAIVGNYYVLSDGKRAESAAVSYAVKAIKSATNSEMTKEQKLKACYNWIINNFSYERDYQDPAKLKNNWTKSYAEYAFKKKRGNCYKYASAMGYCAELLGYDARVVYGKIASGNGRVNHGWTEVKIDGTYYIFDTVQADYYKGNYYRRTYKNYPRTLYKSGTKAISLS